MVRVARGSWRRLPFVGWLTVLAVTAAIVPLGPDRVLASDLTLPPAAPDICTTPGSRLSRVTYSPPQPDVVVIGDSQAVGEWCAGEEALRARARYEALGLSAQVKGVSGMRSITALRLLISTYPRRASLPPSIVFTAGGNDAAAGRTPAQFAAVLRHLLAYLPANRQLYLTTLSYNPNGADATLRARRYAYNDTLRALAGRHPNVHIIDVDLVVRRDHLVFHDNVHLEGAAYNVRASIVAHAVATCQSSTVCPEPA